MVGYSFFSCAHVFAISQKQEILISEIFLYRLHRRRFISSIKLEKRQPLLEKTARFHGPKRTLIQEEKTVGEDLLFYSIVLTTVWVEEDIDTKCRAIAVLLGRESLLTALQQVSSKIAIGIRSHSADQFSF